MEVDAEQPSNSAVRTPFLPPLDSAGDLLPECVAYIRLLILLAALDAGKVQEVCSSELSKVLTFQAGEFAMATAETIASNNRRTMDQLAAKVIFYLARTYELQGRLAELRP